MKHHDLITICLKGLAFWSAFSAGFWLIEKHIGTLLLPLFTLIISQVNTDLSPWLKLITVNHDFSIQLNALFFHTVSVEGKALVEAGQELTTEAHLLHTLVPAVIELSILSIWPVRCYLHRITLIIFGLLTSMIVVGITGPFVLLGKLEIYLQELAEQANLHRTEPWTLTWMIFCEMGGVWLLPILAAIFCIKLQKKLIAKPGNHDMKFSDIQ